MNGSAETHSAPRVLLLGLGVTALSALRSLSRRFDVIGIVRDADPQADPTLRLARRLRVPVICDTTLPGVRATIAHSRPDCVVVSSFNRVLPPDLLAGRRFVNVHYSPLPRYRGRANVNWAIINGEAEVAISIHTITAGLDSGGLLFQQSIPIGPDDTIGQLYERLNALQQEHLADAVARHLAGENGRPQDESEASYCCARIPADGEIDWSWPAQRVHDTIRALSAPFPGAFSYYGGNPLLIWRAALPRQVPRYVGRVPGRVVRIHSDGAVDVLAGDGAVRLLEVQPLGSPRVSAAAILDSTRATLGLRSAELLQRIERLERRLARLEALEPAANAVRVAVS